MSYNPSYEDHQELLLKAHLIELDKLRKEEKRIRNLDSKIPRMTAGDIEKLWIQEMSGDLLNTNEDNEGEEETVENKTETSKNSDKKPKNTTLKRKRKLLIEKLKVYN